jgi:6-phosphogluconolactonase (cycloisomerase 2 family)
MVKTRATVALLFTSAFVAACGGGGSHAKNDGAAGATAGASGGTAGATAGAGGGMAGATAGASGGTAGATAGAGGNVDGGSTDSPTDAPTAPKVAIYANSGTTLNVFDLADNGALTVKTGLAVNLPQILQFADFDKAKHHFYVGATTGTAHYLYAFSINQTTGALTPLSPAPVDGGTADGGGADGGAADAGSMAGLASPNGRVINLTLSRDDKYLLMVHNVTKAYSVFNIATDGTIGAQVAQMGGTDMNVGAFIHQIRVDPSGQYVTICDRGNDPAATGGPDGGAKPEDVGHILTYTLANGVLTPVQTVTFPTGIGPRHLDFHPTKPWVYVAAERGNRLQMYTLQNGMLTQAFDKTSVAVAADGTDRNNQEAINGQRAGAIFVHSSGKFLWIANRNWALMDAPTDGGTSDAGDAGGSDAGPPVQVFRGTGENNIALFSIDQTTGEPTFVQAADSHGFEPRTFALDPNGRFLIVGNQKKINTLTAGGIVTVMPNLSVFQVAVDGKLTFLQSYDQATGEVWWVGGKALSGP